MIPIIILSIVALAILLVKFWTLWRFRVQADKLWQHLHRACAGRQSFVRVAFVSQDHELVLGGSLKRPSLSIATRSAPSSTHRLERLGGEMLVAGLELYMGALATIIGVEPMLGFLGTIVGFDPSLHAMGNHGRQDYH